MPYRIPAETADRIWPDKKEYDEYLQYLKKRHKGSYLAFRLGGESSLRLNKQLEFSLSWRVEHPDPDVEIILIEVPDRKYTGSKNIEKNGIAYVPESLWEELVAYAEEMNRGREEPLIDRSGRQVRNDCEYAGKEMAEDYEYQAYEELRPHDGRRYFARTMYRVHGVDKQVVKYLGGWKSDSIFAEYSHVLSEKEIQNELSRKGVPEDERLANPREAELNQLYGVVEDLADLIEADHKLGRHGIDYKQIANMSEEELIQFKQWRRYEKEEEEQDRTLFEFGSSTSKDDNDSVKATVGLAALTSIFNSSMKRTASQGIHEINSMENDDEMINPATSIGMAQYLLGAGGVTVVMMVMLMMGYPVWATALTLFAAGAWAVSAIEIADPVPSPA